MTHLLLILLTIIVLQNPDCMEAVQVFITFGVLPRRIIMDLQGYLCWV